MTADGTTPATGQDGDGQARGYVPAEEIDGVDAEARSALGNSLRGAAARLQHRPDPRAVADARELVERLAECVEAAHGEEERSG